MREEDWGDVRDWSDWRDRNASIIAHDISQRNQGRWPDSVEEWRLAAAHYDLHLHILPDISQPALTIDSTIIIRLISDQAVLLRRICHEIAEAISQREIGVRTFLFPSTKDEYHEVARRVEGMP